MTKNDFLKDLASRLAFLKSEDLQSAIAFFDSKLSACKTDEEARAVIESFGVPDSLADSIQEASSADHTEAGKPFDLIAYLTDRFGESAVSDDDVIFSKPLSVEKAPEVVQALENREVKTLYGEKVVIESRSEPIEEFILEPGDEANGLTPEEIKLAKAETLEKTEQYTTSSFEGSGASSEETNSKKEDNSSKKKFMLEEEEEEPSASGKSEKEAMGEKEFDGIFNRMFSTSSLPKNNRLLLTILLSILISPVILAIFGIGVTAYACIAAVIVLLAAALFAVMVVFIIIGVLELIYGFLILFDSVAAALIELGFGTILFAIVTAVAAMIYEFTFAIVPKWLKTITTLFRRYVKLLYCYLYGGKA